MPYEFNEGRRHKIPKAQYRIANWPKYDAALVKRGSLTVWMTAEAIAAWQAPAAGKRGGQPIYSAIAIETASRSAWYSTSRCDRPRNVDRGHMAFDRQPQRVDGDMSLLALDL
jgi:hypothetical protein